MIWPIRLECNKLCSNAKNLLLPMGCGHLGMRLVYVSYTTKVSGTPIQINCE